MLAPLLFSSYGSNVDEIWGFHPHFAKGTLKLRTTQLVSVTADTGLWVSGNFKVGRSLSII